MKGDTPVYLPDICKIRISETNRIFPLSCVIVKVICGVGMKKDCRRALWRNLANGFAVPACCHQQYVLIVYKAAGCGFRKSR